MKTTACILLSTLIATAAAADVTKTIENTYAFSADGVITLSNVNGKIEITGWDRNEVSLVAELRAKSQEDLDRISVAIDAQPARLSVETKYEKRISSWWGGGSTNGSVNYTLKVPAGARLESVHTVNSSVRIAGVIGPVNAHTVNGSINATGLAADAELETVNGSIDAGFTKVAASDIRVHTVNGSCELELPGNTNGRLSAGTVNGRVRSDLPVTIEKSKRNSLRGTLGTGTGATIDLGSVNGSITIRGS
jgi:hypothetical protein